MKIKALLGAALLAAGAATSMAQSNVYSLNIVGYVNMSQSPGFRIIANPLNKTNNDVSFLFPGAANYPGLAVYRFNGAGYDISSYDPDAGGWTAPLALNPGVGAWLQVPAGPTFTNTYVGEVILDSTNAIPTGFSMRASVVPQSGLIQTTLGIPLVNGDATYFFNGAGYDIYSIDPDAGGWTPNEPSPAVAQGFWVQNNSGSAKQWIRHFTVQ